VTTTTTATTDLFQINNAEALANPRDNTISGPDREGGGGEGSSVGDECSINPSLPGCQTNNLYRAPEPDVVCIRAPCPGDTFPPELPDPGGPILDPGHPPYPDPRPFPDPDTKGPKKEIQQEKKVCIIKPYLPQCS
jgi:hypothetical protein